MRKSAKKPVQIKKNRIKVSFKSKDIKKNSPKHNSKLLLSNKSSILSSARSCNESTDESDTETEEIPYTTLKFKTTKQKKIYTFKCYKEEDLNFSPFAINNPIISRTCDDDCSSDDERINNAVKKLYNSLLEKVQERKASKEKAVSNKKKKSFAKLKKKKQPRLIKARK